MSTVDRELPEVRKKHRDPYTAGFLGLKEGSGFIVDI